jgi:hypothetical protein
MASRRRAGLSHHLEDGPRSGRRQGFELRPKGKARVIAQIHSDAGQVDERPDSDGHQRIREPDARAKEDRWRVDRASAENDLACGKEFRPSSDGNLDANGAAATKHDAMHSGVAPQLEVRAMPAAWQVGLSG